MFVLVSDSIDISDLDPSVLEHEVAESVDRKLLEQSEEKEREQRRSRW